MPSQLSELVSLIANATKFVEDTFAKTSKPDVPTLDDTAPHPLDNQVSSTEMREAVQTIEGACAQLCALIARPINPPAESIWRKYDQLKSTWSDTFLPRCSNQHVSVSW